MMEVVVFDKDTVGRKLNMTIFDASLTKDNSLTWSEHLSTGAYSEETKEFTINLQEQKALLTDGSEIELGVGIIPPLQDIRIEFWDIGTKGQRIHLVGRLTYPLKERIDLERDYLAFSIEKIEGRDAYNIIDSNYFEEPPFVLIENRLDKKKFAKIVSWMWSQALPPIERIRLQREVIHRFPNSRVSIRDLFQSSEKRQVPRPLHNYTPRG